MLSLLFKMAEPFTQNQKPLVSDQLLRHDLIHAETGPRGQEDPTIVSVFSSAMLGVTNTLSAVPIH